MKSLLNSNTILAVFFLGYSLYINAQENQQDSKDDTPVRPMFESTYLIDNQSVLVNRVKTLEFVIQHRFGTVEGQSDLFGIFGPSNIRLGISYVPIKNLTIGFGTTKNKKYQDFNVKYAIFQQTKSGSFPVSITYFGNMAIDSRSSEIFPKSRDRFSYFNQLIIARKFSSKFSVQVAPSLSHYNAVDGVVVGNTVIGKLNNNHFAVSLGARLKISAQSSILFNYDQPLTDHPQKDPKTNLSMGIEIATGGHAFQFSLGNFSGILPQENNMFNVNRIDFGKFLLGFNISRKWNF